MADGIKSLAKDTAIYGVSSILGKFLNWCLVPLYSYVLASSADYGVVTNLYAWTALCLVVLTYGMETGMFRFMSNENEDPRKVYSVTLISLFFTSSLFVLLCWRFVGEIATSMAYGDHPEYIMLLASVVAMDAFDSIPFAYLRYKNKALQFASLKLLMIFVNIFMNVFFLVGCPYLMKVAPEWIDWFYDPVYGVGYVFVANFISTVAVTIALLPVVFSGKLTFDPSLLKRMLRYSLPLLLLGVVGIMNQTIDKILYPFLFEDKLEAATQLGVYGACFKIAMVMMMFTQAFRYAYEPFVFAKNKTEDSKQTYADSMKYYVISSLFIFLGMIYYLDILKLLIRDDYWGGLVIVPIVLMAYLFQGIYFNLSLWYKLIDKTIYGALISFVGCVLNVALIVYLVPKIGYLGAAWAGLLTYLTMMLISYFLGQKYYFVPYDLKAIAKYFGLTIGLYLMSLLIETQNDYLNYLMNTVLLFVFLIYVIKKDLPLRSIPIINKWIK